MKTVIPFWRVFWKFDDCMPRVAGRITSEALLLLELRGRECTPSDSFTLRACTFSSSGPGTICIT